MQKENFAVAAAALLGSLILSSLMSYAGLLVFGLTDAFPISSSGTIVYGSVDPLNRIFKSDLESVYIQGGTTTIGGTYVDDGQYDIDWGFPNTHYFWVQGYGGTNSYMSLVTGGQSGNPPAHSGSKIGKMYWQNGENRRAQLNFWVDSQEVGLSYWLYLPSNYSNVGWHEIGDLAYTDFYVNLIIWSNLKLNIYNAWLGSGNPHSFYVDSIETVPLGRWFKLTYYAYKHPTNGIAKVWIDDNLIIEINPQGIAKGTGWFNTAMTATSTSAGTYIVGPKIYNDQADPHHVLWFDDIEVWKGAPLS